MKSLIYSLRKQYPGVDLSAHESGNHIELFKIEVPKDQRSQGIGSEIIKALQSYAQSVGKPIVLRPEPERGKKAALSRFYKGLGFVDNKGRNTDYTLSSPTAKTMYWRFKEWLTDNDCWP